MVSDTSLRVPSIGGSTIQTSRRSPAERPGSATSQYSWFCVRSKPRLVSLGARALAMNQDANASVSVNVVIDSVRHASAWSQVSSFSGSQSWSHSLPVRSRPWRGWATWASDVGLSGGGLFEVVGQLR